MTFTRVAGVLLAAGQGSRFGRPKALVELDGQTLAERGIGMLEAGGADPVLIVTGAAEVELGPDHRVRTVYNDEWRTGMGSSLRAALRALTDPDAGPEIGAAVVALADQPLVGAEVTLVECGDTGRPDDIDTPADLEHIAVRKPGSPSCG